MLPPLPEEVDVSGAELDELSDRTRHKIRTAALEAMIQATSLARTSRAIRSRAIAATEVVYRKGDLVDYHRPTTKDVSGWRGPVEVVKCAPTHCAWCDTRDMLADGMTKGSISRSEILNAMIGIFSFKHQIHEHRFQCIDDSAHVHAQTHTS